MVAHTHPSPSAASLTSRRLTAVVASVLALLAVALLPLTARAQGARDSDACARQSTTPPEHEARIAACARVIAASRSQGTRAAVAFHNRGLAYVALGQRERAIQDYDQAIRLNPNNAVAYNDRGVAYAGLGQRERAVQDLDQALRLDPRYMLAYQNRGRMYHALGQPERAIQDYDLTLRFDPRRATAFVDRGVAYAELGRRERAIQDYDQAIRIDPRFAIAYRNRGLSYAGLGQFALAIQDYDQAIRLDPSYTLAYLNRGAAYSALGERDRAAQDYGQAVRLDPSNADGYNGRCYAFAVIGRAADGLADCDRSLQLRPNDANTLDSRAYAYLRLGRLDESLRDYDAAIAAGNSAIARFGRAIVRAGLGDRPGATADLAEARRLNATIDAYAARVSLTAPTFIPAPGETPPVASGPAATPPVASGPVATAPVSSGPVVTPPDSSGPAATSPAVDRDALFWQSIQASTNLGDFEAYLRQFPSGTFAELARNRIAALRAPAAAVPPAPAAPDDLAIVPPQLSWVRGAQGQPVLVIQGVIRNPAAAARPVPPLRVIMRAGEVEIHSWTFTAAAPQVGARAEVPYRTEIADPPQASTLAVVFAPAR